MKYGIEAARKVLAVVDQGLVIGLGRPVPGQLCVEAAVCLALGEPHGDRPSCVATPDRDFKVRLNDARWSSPDARAAGMRRLSVMQLGTLGTDRAPWAAILIELTIRRVLPEALEAAAQRVPAHAEALRAAARRCAAEGTREAALDAKRAADASASAAAYAAATYAADAAYAAAAAADTAYAAERDRILTISARCAEEAYERTGSPGVDLLRQIESEAQS